MLLDETDLFELFVDAVTNYAQARIPASISKALTSARLTALTKKDGESSRHCNWVFSPPSHCEDAGKAIRERLRERVRAIPVRSRPGRAPTASGICRAATDANLRATVLSIDGIGAYDHVLRAAMLSRLEQMPDAKALIPFVMLSYSEPSTYDWVDDKGNRRTASQAEGSEQGDP